MRVLWVPAHCDVMGNEMADQFAKEATSGLQHSVPDEERWEASLSHLSRAITENRSKATSQWILDHVRPERRYSPPAGLGLRRQALRGVRKSLASRYYQLLSGHAAISSFLHERMMGPPRRESSDCRWCGSGKRESRHHLFIECRAWAPQIQRPWERVGKDYRWERPRAPAVRNLWKEGATEAVLKYSADTRVGCWSLPRARRAPREAGDLGRRRRERRVARGRPRLVV